MRGAWLVDWLSMACMLQLSEAGYVSLGLMTTQDDEEGGAWVVGSLTTTTLQGLPLRQLIQGR